MKTVLVIDDSSTVRMYHKKLLETLGFAVDEAINGIEALEKVMLKQYDLFLVDINMPKMDGYRFVEEMRRVTDMEDVPVIMISTEAESMDKDKAFAVGADCYIVKPTKPVDLQTSIKNLLGPEDPNG